MKITYWSDFNCPYSFIGLNRLTRAINELGLRFEWEMKSYELITNLHNTQTTQYIQTIKYNQTPKEAQKEIREIEKIARNEGLAINYENTIITNTKNAHRLVKFTQNKKPEKSQDLIFKIFEATFIDNKNINQNETLIEIGKSVGFSENELEKMILSDAYEIEVAIDNEDARFNGIYYTPCYILSINDEQLTIPGVFEKEDFKIAIKDMISGEIKKKTFL